MPDTKISDLTAFTAPLYTDVLPIVDLTATATKKVTKGNLLKGATVSMQLAATDTISKAGADYICDGTADDVDIQAAIDAVSGNGGGVILLKAGTYTIATSIVPKSNVTLLGEGVATLIKGSANIYAIQSDVSTAVSDFTLDNLKFKGRVTSTPSVPTRARTTSGSGLTGAIQMTGSLNTSSSYPVITNIIIRNCIFQNIESLPVLIDGCSGKITMMGCESTNCLDIGFKFNEEVIFSNNHVKMCADNGVSLSRGNNKITCTGNTFENICGDGIWLSGFSGDKGPNYFSVVGNTIRYTGYNGISVQDAGKYGVISGNYIYGGYYRGAVGLPTNLNCCGINLRGYPVNDEINATDYTTNINVNGNVIQAFPRAGILCAAVHGSMLSNNLILDIGTQYMQDGTTLIDASNTSQNTGILFVSTLSKLNDIQVFNNTVLDQRVAPYCNWGIYPTFISQGNISGNTMNGCRNANNLISRNFGGQVFNRTTVADADYTITTGDYIISYTSLSTGRTVTLPTAVGIAGQQYIIKDESGGANAHNITIATTSSQTIDGTTPPSITTNYGQVRVYSDGANWFTF